MISLFEQILLALPLIIGAYLSISLMKLPDLSLESAYVFGASLAIALQDIELPSGLKIPLIFCASLAGGALVGLTSSLLNQYLRLPFLLSAIITNGLFHGLTQFVLGQSILSFNANFNPLALLPFFPSHPEFGMLLSFNGVVLIGFIVLFKRQLGLAYAIYGNNAQFFKHHGLSTRFVVLTGVCLANACAGLSGYLFAQSNGFVDLTMGYGVVLMGLTSLILGKLIFHSSYPNIAMPLVGVMAYFFIQQLLLNLGFDLKYFNAFQAIFVLVTLAIGHLRKSQNSILSLNHLGV